MESRREKREKTTPDDTFPHSPQNKETAAATFWLNFSATQWGESLVTEPDVGHWLLFFVIISQAPVRVRDFNPVRVDFSVNAV